MDLTLLAVVFLTLSCCLAPAEARNFNSILTVSNGGQWGTWGSTQFCPVGHYANGISLKVQSKECGGDQTALNGIRLHCTDGSTIESKVGPWGSWTSPLYCRTSNLIAFGLQVEEAQGRGDDTAANNVLFACKDGTLMKAQGLDKGTFGLISSHCSGYVCGIQTKVEDDQGDGDDTALNDAKLYCCP